MATENPALQAETAARKHASLVHALGEFALHLSLRTGNYEFARLVTAAIYGDEQAIQRVDQAIEALSAVIGAVDTSKTRSRP